MQILYGEYTAAEGPQHFWDMYFGPQGTAVNPCDVVEPFYRVLRYAPPKVEGASINSPPTTPKEKWEGLPSLYDDAPCYVVGDGVVPPILKCPEDGSVMQVDLAKDPQYDDPIIDCGGGYRYHRVYYAEY